MPKPKESEAQEPPKKAPKQSKKTQYEPPKIEKFGSLKKLIVSGE